MRERKIQVGDDFIILSPNLGDGEIRAITFRHPNIILGIHAPAEEADLSVELEKVNGFSFSTNHPQNVIEGIKVFSKRASVISIYKNLVAALPLATPQLQDEVIVIVEPVAGPTIACACKTLRIFSDD